MSFRFGLTGTFGHYVGKGVLSLAGFVVSTGVIRTAGVEYLQENGRLPEDGRGFLFNIPVQTLNNIKDAVRVISYINDQTSSLDEIYFEKTPDGEIKLVKDLIGTEGQQIRIAEGAELMIVDKASIDSLLEQSSHNAEIAYDSLA